MRTAVKIIIGLVLVVGVIIYWYLDKFIDASSPTYNRIELTSVDNEKLYIKSKNWGITGDSQLTIITTEDEKEFEIDTTKQIVFNELEPFIYKVSNDTLFLTLRQKIKIPDDFKSHWTIIQNEVDNPTMMDLKQNPKLKQI